MFGDMVGFGAPSSVKEIKYKDHYNRGFMDGGWGRWIAFTFDTNVYSRLIEQEGFKEKSPHSDEGRSETAPKWWPKKIPDGSKAYARTQDDTKAIEGFSFREVYWHDTNSNLVFGHKSYWD